MKPLPMVALAVRGQSAPDLAVRAECGKSVRLRAHATRHVSASPLLDALTGTD
jgi:hypothetical protein